jgi:hypothetical protein
MSKQAIVAIILTLFFHSVHAQVDLNENCLSAYKDIIALRFSDARLSLAEERSSHPENMMVPYLENYMDFLTVFISEDEEEFDFLEENKSQRIDLIKKLSDTSRFRNYMLGNIHLQWAVARLKFRQYVTAALEINKAYRLLEKNAKDFPDFLPNNITLGVLHIMIGMVPEKYQWLLDIISMKGSVEQGREELYLVLRMSNENEVYRYLHDETLFYLGFVELNIQPDEKRISQLSDELEKASLDNLLLTYLRINILMKTGNNSKALSTFKQMEETKSDFLPFYYLDYLYGESLLRNLKTNEAKEKYELFLTNFKGRNYIKDAHRKKAWATLINNDQGSYLIEISKVEDAGVDDVDIDKEAEREAESGKVPNSGLIQARLLFDGGYYHRADSILNNTDTVGFSDEMKLEYTYRKARVAHESGEIESAKDLYLRTIEQGSELKRYYAGNSALKLGEIYESEMNNTTALFYYKLCLGLDFDEYEVSIHSKAQAASERLSE